MNRHECHKRALAILLARLKGDDDECYRLVNDVDLDDRGSLFVDMIDAAVGAIEFAATLTGRDPISQCEILLRRLASEDN